LGCKALQLKDYFQLIDGSINAREVNGVKQSYKYDQMGQLLAVVNAAGGKVEQYTYDNAGNILKKDVGGKVTSYTYDNANQLVSSTTDGKVTDYKYDAAGRMIKEGDKSYAYGWQDKVMNITQNGKVTNSYTYSMSGQIASVSEQGKQESFLWDGLALIKRGTTEYVYEPSVTGGNPILANGKGLFNDMLGNTLGVIGEKDKFTSIKRDAFGKTLENKAGSQYNMFTGKPQIGGLGYAFLFRNYRPNLGKWQTRDPLGYPDGWNNLAYVNNHVTSSADWLGAWAVDLTVTRITSLLSRSDNLDVIYDYDNNTTTATYTVDYTIRVDTSWTAQTFYCDNPTCPGHTVAAGSSVGTTVSPPLVFETIWYYIATPEEVAAAGNQMMSSASTAINNMRAEIEKDNTQGITLTPCNE